MSKSLILLNAEADALTVSWTETAEAIRYVLQCRRGNDKDDDAFETLSENLKSTQVRKKNLVDQEAQGFVFRVAAIVKEEQQPSEWTTHSEPFHLLSAQEASTRMDAPKVMSGGTSFAGIVSWKAATGADSKYELQLRENVGGAPWETISSSLSNTEVKKKNLTSTHGYQFRVRLAGSEAAFSPPSEPFVSLGLSPGIKQLFSKLEKGTLLRQSNDSTVTLEDALGGKEFILLYASASWCGPCRNFTPMLKQCYQSLGPNKPIEIVFLSADHDESSFRQYYGHMPWIAINFDEDAREELMAYIRVSGIPRLCVLDGRTGRIIEDNAVGKPFEISRWRKLVGGK